MSITWDCPECPRTYAYKRTCQNHIVSKHDYRWWDDKEVCKPNQLHNPTGPIKMGSDK